MKGFLGTGATFYADLNLIVQLAMGVALLVGMRLARKKKFKPHKYCQSAVMILNLVMIFLIMAPSFHKQVQPEVFGGLKGGYYLLPFIHTVLGTIAELLGLYIVVAAGTKILPKKLPYKRYKPLMRACLTLWWVTILFGVGTYYYWYVRQEPVAPPKVETKLPEPTTGATPKKVTVNIKNFEFSPKEVSIEAGTTVEWIDEQGKHTVEADDGSFKSETLTANGKYEHKFDSPGSYPYYCTFHGDKHGTDMAGVVKVTEGSK
jgi:plastocyanin/uncharacterized membrane protein YozB (DUF420 family)